MKTVAFIPIKLNSERLPRKNMLPLAGKPLCWHVPNTLLHVSAIDEVYVYCSDEAVLRYLPPGVLFKKRDAALDGNLVKGMDIYRSFVSEVDADIYVLAHATSPFISRRSFENALSRVLSGEHDSAFSAERVQTFAWYNGKPLNYDLCDVPRTQDMAPLWIETSAFYIFRKEICADFHRRIGFAPYVQEVGGAEAIDIDERADYEFAVKISAIQNNGGGA